MGEKVVKYIEVFMQPNNHDNPHKPHFWAIMAINEKGDHYNTGLCGWEATPEEAFTEANKTYKTFNAD